MSDYRNVWVLFVAGALLQLGGGILGVTTPLGLDALGVGTTLVGIIAALFAIGFMIGAWFATPAIRLFGNIRTYSAGAAIAAVTVLMMYMALDIWAWSVIRLAQGVALALMFSSIEAWLSAAVPARSRGGVTGFYHLVAKIALIVGPFVVAGATALDAMAYMWPAIFFCLSLVPISLTQRQQPPVPDTAPLSLPALFQLAPAGFLGALVAGVVNTGILSLLPLYAVEVLDGFSLSPTGIAALAAGVAWGGGMLSQWPAGRVSDMFDRRSVIAVMVAPPTLVCILLASGWVEGYPYLTLVLIGIWGAGSLSYYGIAVAHTIDWAPSGQIAQAMAGLLFVWALGSVIGPILMGLAMRTPLGAKGLFIPGAICSGLLIISMMIRRAAREEPPEDFQEPWNPTTPLLVSKGEIDPRAE